MKEAPITLEQLFDADEVLVTNSGALCNKVSHIDGKPVGGKAGELVRRLQEAYAQWFNRETHSQTFQIG